MERIALKRLVTTKNIFIVSLLVAVLTILSIWLFGLGQHRSLYVNSILSTTILSVSFFLFITVGLYKGIKLKDDLGKITDKIELNKLPDVSGMDFSISDMGDDIGGLVLGILGWVLVALIAIAVIWILSPILWALILVFAAMLYWIFFRALRLVFKNSPKCRGNLWRSAGFGLTYTVLYNFWIYGIILASHYLAA